MEGESHRIIFCDQHQLEFVELIHFINMGAVTSKNGGIVREYTETETILAGELSLRALTAIEDFMMEIIKPLIAEKFEKRLEGKPYYET